MTIVTVTGIQRSRSTELQISQYTDGKRTFILEILSSIDTSVILICVSFDQRLHFVAVDLFIQGGT